LPGLASSRSAEGEQAAGCRVLLIATDEGERRTLQRVLTEMGCESFAAPSAEAAICQLALDDRGPVVLTRVADPDEIGPLLARFGAVAPVRVAILDCWPAAAPVAEAGGATRLIGGSAAMRALAAMIEKLARHKATVLITGESGTGKELVARAIHERGPRAHRAFVAINCAAIPPQLLESELFGHVRGAFTDAVRDKPGLFEEASGGTLFLDEVGELPFGLQVKLLRAIQEEEIRRVGSNQSTKIDVRVIAATLRDLNSDVRAGRFREDLFYRLNVLPVLLPPLRERPDDIALLAEHFVAQNLRKHPRLLARSIGADAIELLRAHPWPGNVRQLENTIEQAMVLCDAPVVDARWFAAKVAAPAASEAPGGDGAGEAEGAHVSIKKATRALEEELIRRALEQTGGNRTTAARLLEISHRALLYKIKEYGI
jgi:two-component system response regulator AtoC